LIETIKAHDKGSVVIPKSK